MNLYVPILVLALIGGGFAVFSIVASILAGGPRRYNRAKLDSYECGIDPTPQPSGGGRFPVKYYITAMTFIVFDIEVMFLVPWAVAFDDMAMFGLLAMLAFLFAVTVAFVYEWKRGGLEWD